MNGFSKEEQEDMKKLMEAFKKIPTWIKLGQKLIYPQRNSEWEEVVNQSIKAYKGIILDDTIPVMEMLEEGKSFEEVSKVLDSQNHSGSSFCDAMFIITKFSKKGPQFQRYISKNISPEFEGYLQKIEKQNETFELELQKKANQNNKNFEE